MMGLGVYWFGLRPEMGISAQESSGGGKPVDPAAARVERVLEELEENYSSGRVPSRSYILTEPEINAYLEVELRRQERKEVETFLVQLKTAVLVSFLTVNMDEIEVKGDSMTLHLFKALLKGRAHLEVEGELSAENGKGAYSVRSARLNDLPVPASLVNLILSAVGKRQDPPFDPTQPFDLPYGIESIRIEPGKATIVTGGDN